MKTTLEEFINMAKKSNPSIKIFQLPDLGTLFADVDVQVTKAAETLGQELNRDIIDHMRLLDSCQSLDSEMRKDFNKQRISALKLTLIQGGKA